MSHPISAEPRRKFLSLNAITLALAGAIFWMTPLRAEVVLHVPADVATIQQAIDTVPDGGTIEIAGGTYPAPAASFVISNEGRGFTLRAAPAATVILDGQSARTVLKFTNTSVAQGRPVIFENLIFANGRSTTNAQGGGATLRYAHATFRNCTFRDNEASPTNTGGGGVLAYDQVTLFFIDCLFEDNVAKNEGAGLKIDGTNAAPSVAFVHRCRFENNLANPPGHRNTAAGGGIHVGNANVWITNSRFTGNEAGYVGGAVFGIGTWSSPVTTPRAQVFIANSTFVGNRAASNGVVTPDAPEAGAVHGEDQVTTKIWNSRFEENSAGLGGAIVSYRSILEIHDSVLRGNRATATGPGTGFGGAIAAVSNDTGVDGATNRRSASLLLTRSLLQGRFGATTTSAQSGGCLYAAGDIVRRAGIGVPQVTDPTQTRASITIQDSVFHDCDVASMASIPNGGGFELFHVNASLSDLLVVESDALGTGSGGGGGRINGESLASLNNVVFSDNTAVQFGGALYLAGADVDITGGAFIANGVSAGFGGALFVTGHENFPTAADDQDAFGTIANVLFSENTGGAPIWDDDTDNATRFYNDVRYNGNTFWHTSTTIYGNSIAGSSTAAQLNALVVNRTNFPDTDKSSVANSFLASAPAYVALRIVPPEEVAVTAAGDPLASTQSFAGLAWAGGSATFDGNPVSGNADLLPVSPGNHSLEVGASTANDSLAVGPVPAGTLVASPESISGGGNSLLAWTTTSGDELSGALDQALPAPGPNDGSQSVSPVASTTYTFLAITEQGAADLERTVFVDEMDPIFEDGFESEDTGAWSDTVP